MCPPHPFEAGHSVSEREDNAVPRTIPSRRPLPDSPFSPPPVLISLPLPRWVDMSPARRTWAASEVQRTETLAGAAVAVDADRKAAIATAQAQALAGAASHEAGGAPHGASPPGTTPAAPLVTPMPRTPVPALPPPVDPPATSIAVRSPPQELLQRFGTAERSSFLRI